MFINLFLGHLIAWWICFVLLLQLDDGFRKIGDTPLGKRMACKIGFCWPIVLFHLLVFRKELRSIPFRTNKPLRF